MHLILQKFSLSRATEAKKKKMFHVRCQSLEKGRNCLFIRQGEEGHLLIWTVVRVVTNQVKRHFNNL